MNLESTEISINISNLIIQPIKINKKLLNYERVLLELKNYAYIFVFLSSCAMLKVISYHWFCKGEL